MKRRSSRDDYDDRLDEADHLEEPTDDEPLRIVDQLLLQAPDRDPARPLLYQLRRQLMDREISYQEARRAAVELEAALGKVTAPANRVGIFLGLPSEGIATVFVGGSEYFTNIDPRVEVAELHEHVREVGDGGERVRVPVAKHLAAACQRLPLERLRLAQHVCVAARAAEVGEQHLLSGEPRLDLGRASRGRPRREGGAARLLTER